MNLEEREQENIDEIMKQARITNFLLVLIGKILLESNQGQIEDKTWHKWDDQIKELKRMIE